MARTRVLDMLQNYSFWVFDASGVAGNLLFTIFDPVLGFSGCTLPEITVEHREVKPGNWPYKHRAVKAADVSSFTLQRGTRWYDSDFYIWLSNAIKGLQPLRRDIIIVQFLGLRISPQNDRGRSNLPPEIGTTVLTSRIPARAWFCSACLPSRYKPGGDLDATSGDVSIQELDLQPEMVEEITVSTLSPVAARALSVGLAIGEAAGASALT